jgi:hypothetical protein
MCVPQEMCPCGLPLHYPSPEAHEAVRQIIQTLGPNIPVRTRKGCWSVPRHYIALHGLSAQDLPTLAQRYNWPEIQPQLSS